MYLLVVKLLFNGSCCIGTSTVLVFYYFPIIILCRVLFSCLSRAFTDICVSHFPLNVWGGMWLFQGGGGWPLPLNCFVVWPISIWLSYLHYSLVHWVLSMEIVFTSWWFIAEECWIVLRFVFSEFAKKKVGEFWFWLKLPSGNFVNLCWTSGGFVLSDVLRTVNSSFLLLKKWNIFR